ncbi:MAG: hypothetical protein R6X25_05150 [Candidatus Krumholzibacteriia bacterium]
MVSRAWIPTVVVLLASANLATAAAASDDWKVVLEDGRSYEGTLVRLQPGRYLLQTDDALLELTDDDIAPRTFDRRPREEVPARPVREIRQFHDVHADGTTTASWTRRGVNPSDRALTEYRFGFAPWEQRVADQRSWYDGFGNRLEPEFDPPQSKWKHPPKGRVQVTLPLSVPVAPGEEYWITGKETSQRIMRTKEGLVYRFGGDFAEDNLLWLKVRLPAGADVVSIEPQPSARFTDEGREYVMWRRYYRAGDATPLTIVYTLD